jgi:hypothetical protein
MKEMALSDWTSGSNYARREGMREIAANMKRRGVPLDRIAEDTGLSVEDIPRL